MSGLRYSCLLPILLAAVACGSVSADDPDAALPPGGADAAVDGAPMPDAPPDGFLITAAASLEIVQGASATLEVQVERGASFDEAVTVSVQDLPAGVTAQAIVVDAASTTGTLTLQATGQAAQGGPTTFTVKGDGGDAPAQTASVALVVRGTPGAPDTSFGTGGALALDFGAQAIILQPDGKAVLTGQRNSDVAVLRVTTDGENDSGFATGGELVFPVMSATDEGSGLALQPDGKIIVAGNAGYPSNVRDTMVARVTGAGALDPSFGSGGKVTVDITGGAPNSGFDYARGVVVQPDGKIVSVSAMQREIAFLRFDTAGVLDPTFGNGGKSVIPTDEEAEVTGMTLQPDGKLLVVGKQRGVGTSDQVISLVRVLPTGGLDPDFGSGGKQTYAAFQGSGSAAVRGHLLLADGKILIVGGSGNGAQNAQQAYVMRLLASGKPDTSFDGDGVVLFEKPAQVISANAAAVYEQADGKLIVVGGRFENSVSVTSLVRLSPTGAVDASFGTGGKVDVPISGGQLKAVFTSDGRALIVDTTGDKKLLRVWL